MITDREFQTRLTRVVQELSRETGADWEVKDTSHGRASIRRRGQNMGIFASWTPQKEVVEFSPSLPALEHRVLCAARSHFADRLGRPIGVNIRREARSIARDIIRRLGPRIEDLEVDFAHWRSQHSREQEQALWLDRKVSDLLGSEPTSTPHEGAFASTTYLEMEPGIQVKLTRRFTDHFELRIAGKASRKFFRVLGFLGAVENGADDDRIKQPRKARHRDYGEAWPASS